MRMVGQMEDIKGRLSALHPAKVTVQDVLLIYCMDAFIRYFVIS
jgi:hypothetical protein